MEGLDMLKGHWNDENRFQKIPRNELYDMTHKSSSSTVKWIVLISVAEFLFWLIMPLLSSDDANDKGSKLMLRLGLGPFMNVVSYINYALIFIFMILFYRNYKKIKLTDNSRQLMNNIIKVRKTVMYYINISLGLVLLRGIISFVTYFLNDPAMITLFSQSRQNGKLTLMIIIAVLLSLVVLGIITGVVWFYYRIIYGILLKKLFRNYENLKNNAM